MDLKKRLTKELIVIGSVFLIILIIISALFLQFNNSLNSLIKESEPVHNTMEHMLLDVYQDNVLLVDYLSVQEYNTALNYDEEVKKLNSVCNEVENNMGKLIITGLLEDEEIINYYNDADQIHSEVEEIKDKLILLHKKELANNESFNVEKEELLDKYNSVFKKAVNTFTENIEKINERNESLRNSLLFQFKSYLALIFLLIFFFLAITIYKIRKIGTQIIQPIDELINKTGEFVDGNYAVTLKPTNDISELSDLQKNINNIFKVVKKTILDNHNKNNRIESNLLREEYTRILDFLKQNSKIGKKITITRLKKYLKITHPTVLTRIKFLEERGYISIERDGREKFLILTVKEDEF